MVYKITDLIVPVELESFSASKSDLGIKLEWTTASELNNKGFEIQRKSCLVYDWNALGFVNGKGTTSEKNYYTFEDKNIASGKIQYRLNQVDFDGKYTYSDIVEIEFNPTSYSLKQNYPNPFNPTTRIDYQLPFDSKVTLELYEITGEKISTLISSNLQAGSYFADINAGALNLASGVYFYKMTAIGGVGKSFTQIKKLMLMK
jgi:hypothetical protein